MYFNRMALHYFDKHPENGKVLMFLREIKGGEVQLAMNPGYVVRFDVNNHYHTRHIFFMGRIQ